MTDSGVRIDGAYGEGGGQALRTSLSLAAVTGRPVEIANIRAGRSRPGLQPQHLASVRAAAQLCQARLDGDSEGSSRLLFAPQSPVSAGDYHFTIRTAGAATLVAQTVLLPLLHAGASARKDDDDKPRRIRNLPLHHAGESAVTIDGGTHVPHAPAADYLELVYAPALRRFGYVVQAEYAAAGFFPRGGGQVRVDVSPGEAGPIRMEERGRLLRLRARIVTSGLPDHVAARGAAAVERFMKGIGREVEIERRTPESPGPGAAVVIAAECEGGFAGFTGIGERGKPMETVAEAPCRGFLAWWKSGAACDEHLADQLVLPAALTPGENRWTTPTVTEHLRTVLWVAAHFTPIDAVIQEHTPAATVIVHSPEYEL